MDFGDDVEFEIFDEATSKKIQDEHEKDMADAAKAIGAGRMGLITGDSEKSTATPSAAGTGLMGKLASATSFFSRKKTPTSASTPAPVPTPAAPAPAPSVPVAPVAPATASNSSQPSTSSSSLPPPPAAAAAAAEGKPEAPTLAKEEGEGRPPEEPATMQPATAIATATPPEAPDAEKEKGPLALPVPAAATPAHAAHAAQPTGTGTETEEPKEPTATVRSHPEEKVEVDAAADRTGSTLSSAAPVESEPAKAVSSTSTVAPDTAAAAKPAAAEPAAAEVVLPELRVVTFEVREPSLGAAVVGHVAILEGSCYVWAGTEGLSAQGSLAAAVGTRFDGGMPTATPLLAGEGAGEAGAAGGVSVSMAQRLCRRTGRVVFVSCDLSEDSQILVAAVEAKVVALLKADD